MKIDNSVFEKVEEFKYLGTNLTNQNSIQEEIKSRLKLGNAGCHLVQDILSSSLLSKDIKIYRTIILPAVLYGCETWSFTFREERRVRMSENRVLREYLCLKGTSEKGNGEEYIMRSLIMCTLQPILFGQSSQKE